MTENGLDVIQCGFKAAPFQRQLEIGGFLERLRFFRRSNIRFNLTGFEEIFDSGKDFIEKSFGLHMPKEVKAVFEDGPFTYLTSLYAYRIFLYID